MKAYYDTGLLLKLYTPEKESIVVESWVKARGQPLWFTALHRSECFSALRLKQFRGECTLAQCGAAMDWIAHDIAAGILNTFEPDWDRAWDRCALLTRTHASGLGCRTLDTLHVAIALENGFREFLSHDTRQKSLASAVGLKVTDPIDA